MTDNRKFTDSDRAAFRQMLGGLLDELDNMDDSDVCGVLSGALCYGVFKSGGVLGNALQIVQETWPALERKDRLS